MLDAVPYQWPCEGQEGEQSEDVGDDAGGDEEESACDDEDAVDKFDVGDVASCDGGLHFFHIFPALCAVENCACESCGEDDQEGVVDAECLAEFEKEE